MPFGLQSAISNVNVETTANSVALARFKTNGSIRGYVGYYTANGGAFGFYDGSAALGLSVIGGGNVGIGTTAPANKLDLNGSASIGYVNKATPSNGLLVSGNVGIGTSTPVAMLHVGSAAAVGIIADLQNTAGYCTLNPSSNTLISTCTSDIRLKTNIRDAGDVQGWIGGLRLREFTLKATGERRMGVCAAHGVSLTSVGAYLIEKGFTTPLGFVNDYEGHAAAIAYLRKMASKA